MVPIWSPDKLRLQTIRAGFPCFNAALTAFVEATRDDDRERNRLCPPCEYPDSPASWARMHARSAIATRTFGAEADIAAWQWLHLEPVADRAVASRRSGHPCGCRTPLLHVERGLQRLAELGVVSELPR